MIITEHETNFSHGQIRAFLSADSFSSALLVRLEEDEEDGDDFFQKFGKERKNLLKDLYRRSTTKG